MYTLRIIDSDPTLLYIIKIVQKSNQMTAQKRARKIERCLVNNIVLIHLGECRCQSK